MKEEFNRQNVIDNIMLLVQNSQMKVGEIEKKLGLSAGYLSRLSRKDNDSSLSVELLWKISRLFDVSMNTLVNGCIREEDKMVSYMRKFIAKLNAKTGSGEMIWHPITIKRINDMLMDNSRVAFPVSYYHKAGFPKEPPHVNADPIQVDYALSCYGEMKVVSAAYEGIMVNPQDTVYFTTIEDNQGPKSLYLACYCTECETGATEFYELMLVDDEEEMSWWNHIGSDYEPMLGKSDIPPYVSEVCNTLVEAWKPISNEVKDLFYTVKSHEYDIQLPMNVKSTINQFLADNPELSD